MDNATQNMLIQQYLAGDTGSTGRGYVPNVNDAISGADLAGLTATDVSQALSGATQVQSLRQRTQAADKASKRQKFNDLFDVMYKNQLTRESAARTKKYGQPTVAKPSALDQPFMGGYTLREFQSLTPRAKEYTLAKGVAGNLGDKKFMSPEEWADTKPTDKERFLRAAMEDPKLMGAAKELAEATRAPVKEPTRPLVTWTTAMHELTKRFGKMDPTGMWAVTPELQVAHDKAQEFLNEYKGMGVEPMKAINDANKQARVWIADREKRFYDYMNAAQKIKNKDERRKRIEQVRQAYLAKYGYEPSIRR